jgi:hypothetical protein
VHLRRLTSVTLVSALLGLLACETSTPSDPDAAARADAPRADAPRADAPGLDAPSADDAFTPTADAPGADAPSTGERVGVFVAQGYAGRVSVSCDDGRTWTFDREDALTDEMGMPLPPVARCFDGVDCDHHPGRAKGIVFHHGWFVRTNGWGPQQERHHVGRDPRGHDLRRHRDEQRWRERGRRAPGRAHATTQRG